MKGGIRKTSRRQSAIERRVKDLNKHLTEKNSDKAKKALDDIKNLANKPEINYVDSNSISTWQKQIDSIMKIEKKEDKNVQA
jgi:hypothetical protein